MDSSKSSDVKLIDSETDEQHGESEIPVKNRMAEVPLVTAMKKGTTVPPCQERERNDEIEELQLLKEENPQEAYSPSFDMLSSSPISPINETQENQTSKKFITSEKSKKHVKALKKRKRARLAHVRVMANTGNEDDRMKLPLTQFETVLRRRAIRKCGKEETAPISSRSASNHNIFGPPRRKNFVAPNCDDVIEGYDEEIGDTSLGMKLNM